MRVASRYAELLLSLGGGEKDLRSLALMNQLLASNPHLLTFLKAPPISKSQKEELLSQSLSVHFDKSFMEFLFLLVETGRVDKLALIEKEFQKALHAQLGKAEAELITASALTADIEREIKEKIEKYFQKELHVTKKIDPSLIGGMVVIVGNQLLDGSIKGRLRKIRAELKEA